MNEPEQVQEENVALVEEPAIETEHLLVEEHSNNSFTLESFREFLSFVDIDDENAEHGTSKIVSKNNFLEIIQKHWMAFGKLWQRWDQYLAEMQCLHPLTFGMLPEIEYLYNVLPNFGTYFFNFWSSEEAWMIKEHGLWLQAISLWFDNNPSWINLNGARFEENARRFERDLIYAVKQMIPLDISLEQKPSNHSNASFINHGDDDEDNDSDIEILLGTNRYIRRPL